ncbi:MAG TPA: IS110 family transposase [Planctomycetota bacterium]|nr:IS110 family transposase [Planctomycetota bacterium]
MVDAWSHFVGVDWASAEHEVCVLDGEGKQVDARAVKHSGDGLAELCGWLAAKGEARSIAVAIEVPHGSVVETLLDRGFTVFSINPKQLDRFRDRFTLAGAKDDRRDAMVLAASLRTDHHLFRRLSPQPAKVIALREWSRMHDELQSERNGLVNQIRAQLSRYYPAFLAVAADPGEDWAAKLFAKVPSPDLAARVRVSTIRNLLKSCRIRRISAEEVLSALRQRPVFSAPGTAEAAQSHLRFLYQRVTLVNTQVSACKKRMEAQIEDLGEDPDEEGLTSGSDVRILQSLPGVGVIVASVLIGEASEAISKRDYNALRALAGVAPVTKRSGKKKQVVMRTACHPRLRNALYHWARVATMNDKICKDRYAALRARGKSHGQALRTVSDRLLGVLCAMLKTKTLFRASEEIAA